MAGVVQGRGRTGQSVLAARARLLELLRVDDVGVEAARLGEELREDRAGDAAADEDYNGGGQHRNGTGDRRGYVLQRTAGVPIVSVSWLNASAEMIAPALPHAALMPCAAALNFVGKTSAG